MEIVIWSVAVLAGLGIIFGAGLGIASKKLAIKVDERVEAVRELLPGANCGGCGFPGCDGFAAAVVAGEAQPGGCSACSQEKLAEIGEVLGVAVEAGKKKVARLLCQGSAEHCKDKTEYDGVPDCKAAALVASGFKMCRVACLGLGTCAQVCPFGAIAVENGIAVIDEEKCTGCGKCAEECPRSCIALLEQDATTYAACRNQDKGKAVLSVCTSGCISCKLCEKTCPEKAITMQDNLPVIDYEKCTGCGLCAQKCKPGCIVYMGECSDAEETA